MASFRFLHAADIHLDSPLRGIARQVGSAAEQIGVATREALSQLVGLAIDRSVDFVVIAGDLYDGDWRDFNTGLFFVGQMGRLNEAGIPVYLLYGNHDAESRITKQLELPENVHVFGARKAASFRIEHLNVALHGQSYRQRDVTDNLVPDYPAPTPGAFNIGVLHTGLGGMDGHDDYAPCSVDELVNKGYSYWALGHVHGARVLHEHPHVVFPGNLQGRHVRETGAKGACLVTVEDNSVRNLESVACDVVRWCVRSIPLDDVDTMNGVYDRIRDELNAAVDKESDGRLLACRIVLEGRTQLHDRLLASEEQILVEARAAALGLGSEVAWIEKVVISTAAPVDARSMAEREDAVGELQRLLQNAGNDEELLERIGDELGALVRQLPHQIRDIEDPLMTLAINGEYNELIAKTIPYLSAHLTSGKK